jgi:DNA-binding NarL/FixJ family response regulator
MLCVGKDISMICALAVPPIRILVVDDHCVVREGLAVLLDRGAGLTIVGTAGTGEEAVLAARRLRPDVIIMDLVLPALSGIEATRRIISELPNTRIIALSACHTSEHVCRALRAGARGYVLKTAAGSDLQNAIKAVTAGEQYVSPEVTALFVDGVLSTSIPESLFDSLSVRERDVLQHIVAGETSSDIARHLSLSRKTVDTYRGRMMVKLGVANRSELIRLALEYALPVP